MIIEITDNLPIKKCLSEESSTIYIEILENNTEVKKLINVINLDLSSFDVGSENIAKNYIHIPKGNLKGFCICSYPNGFYAYKSGENKAIFVKTIREVKDFIKSDVLPH